MNETSKALALQTILAGDQRAAHDSPQTNGEHDAVVLVAHALSGDRKWMDALIARLEPIIRARVLRTLSRRARPIKQRALEETDDIVQCVFEKLFRNCGRVLASWRPELGLSLRSFVALVSEREAGMFLRSGRRNPFREEALSSDLLELHAVDERAPTTLEARDLLRSVVAALKRELGEKGRRVFELLFVEARSLGDVALTTGLSHAAVYAWRTRIVRAARSIRATLQRDGRVPRRVVYGLPSLRGVASQRP
jgi:RNA polymerase sigma factor (sigma-70 family)